MYYASVMSRLVEIVCNIVLFLIAADFFSSDENVHHVGLCNKYLEIEIILHLKRSEMGLQFAISSLLPFHIRHI